jgi:Uma2 family endonuclease
MSMSDMTAALDLLHANGWTTDDLDALPEDGHRRELIDGVLHVSPSPTSGHQKIVMFLGVQLAMTCPPEYEVTHGVEVRINSRNSLTPDLLVVTAVADARNPSHFAAHEVVLAVEIVSPSSMSMDRVLKPALYAAAGIPFYWRIETKGAAVVHTHRLDPTEKIYVPTGEHATTIEVTEPWPISVRVADIVGHGSGPGSIGG